MEEAKILSTGYRYEAKKQTPNNTSDNPAKEENKYSH